MKVFIETDVLLDFLLRRDPFYGAAARLFTRVEAGDAEAYISAISFNNIFYLARKDVGRDAARRLLIDLRKLCRVVPLDEAVLDQAIVSPVKDFEDAIQAVSALRATTAYVVTRNPRDFGPATLRVYSADEFLALLDSPPAQPGS